VPNFVTPWRMWRGSVAPGAGSYRARAVTRSQAERGTTRFVTSSVTFVCGGAMRSVPRTGPVRCCATGTVAHSGCV
jgi:hypothetical protein